jgi:hypothetical protein
VRAEVNGFMSRLADGIEHDLFERETRMVKTNSNFHGTSLK